MSSLSDGTVVVPTPDGPYKLRPTLEAMEEICDACGDILSALERVARQDIRAIHAVVVAGAGLQRAGQSQAVKAAKAAIFQAGTAEVSPLVGQYLKALLRGGRGEDEPAPSGETAGNR